MKKVILRLFLIALSLGIMIQINSQDWKWTGHASGISDLEDITGMCCDPSGNVFVTGTFSTGSFLNGTALTTQGLEDIFIAKCLLKFNFRI